MCLIYPLLRPRLAAWRELSWAAALAYGFLPLLNALTTDKHLLNTTVAGDWVMAAFDLTALLFGVLFAVLASRIRKRTADLQAFDDGTTPSVAVS